jgi:hypothetical protein
VLIYFAVLNPVQDDRFISRLDSGDSNAQAEYRFRLPLKQVANLPLTLTCDVKVRIDEPKRTVIISAVEARMRPSTKDDDEMQIPTMNGTLPPQQSALMTANVTESVKLADMAVRFLPREPYLVPCQGLERASFWGGRLGSTLASAGQRATG